MPTKTKRKFKPLTPAQQAVKREETYQRVTDIIVKQLESGVTDANWSKPWRAITSLPTNIESGNHYRGINVLALAAAAADKGYDVPVWGTYRQWALKGGQVRKDEESSVSILFKSVTFKDKIKLDANGDPAKVRALLVKAWPVFNIAQVDGVDMTPYIHEPVHTDAIVPAAEAVLYDFVARGATIKSGGDRAYYTPAADMIQLPNFDTFISANHFYSTAFHETGHATGHEKRLNRDLSGRFGTEQYAAEELVAELTSAMVMGELGLEVEPREDHAEYIASWLKLLKHDNKAIFTAAAHAQRAADLVLGETAQDEAVEPETVADVAEVAS